MSADWVEAAVAAFGRQMGLGDFRPRERGTCAVRLENGLTLAFERLGDTLAVVLSWPAPGEAPDLEALFTLAHPEAQPRGMRMRAAYFAGRRAAALTVRLPEREVTAAAIETVFRALWTAAARARGGTA